MYLQLGIHLYPFSLILKIKPNYNLLILSTFNNQSYHLYFQIHKLQSTLSSRVVASNKRGTGRVEKKQHYEITSFYSLCAFCSNTLSSLICSLGLFGYLQVLFPHHQNPKIGIIDGCCLLLMVFIYFALMVVITG